MDEDKTNKSNAAILIGFVLILLVGIGTYGRSFYEAKNNRNANANVHNDTQNTNSTEYKGITPDDLSKMIDIKENVLILDLRDPDAFATEHILDSKNIASASPGDILGKPADGKTFVLADETGPSLTEKQMIDAMIRNGYEDVSYLSGGISQWKQKFYPLITAGDPYSIADQAKVNYISSDDLKKYLDEKQNIVLIDVRKTDAFSGGHLPGAINIFLDDLEQKRDSIPIGRKIVLYDKDGLWAFQAAVRLSEMGIMNTAALSDGFDVWTKKNYPVAK